MAPPYVRSVSGVGKGTWIQISAFGRPNLGLQVDVTGTATWQIEGTFDNVQDSTVVPVVFVHPTLTGQTASKQGEWTPCPLFVRPAITAGTGSITLTANQYDGPWS